MASLIRLAAILAAACVALSFLAFAVSESDKGSQSQLRTLDGGATTTLPTAERDAIQMPAPPPAVERVREAGHSAVREAIDDANDVLSAPFADITGSENPWVVRLAAGVLGLLAYGLGGFLLANALPRRKREISDWREATS